MLVSNALVSLLCGAASAYIARNRGKNPYLWFFLGALFGIFGLLFLFFDSKSRARARSQPAPIHDPNTIDITPKFDPSYKEKFWYYLDPLNKQNGPMSFDALLRAFSEKRVFMSTYVWNDGLDNWKPLSDFIQ